MKILESYKKMATSLLLEIDDEKMIKYKDKDGESKEMKAGSAKTMPDDHPAKQAWQKMSDAEKGGDDSEKDAGDKLGGGDFDRDGGSVRDYDPDVDTRSEPEVKQAIKSAEKVADKYGIESDIAGNEQGLSRVNIGTGGEYEGDNQLTVSYDDKQYHVGIQGEDAMQGPIGYMSFDSKEEMESALDKILGNEKIKDALKKGDSLEGMKDEIESLGKGGSDSDEEKSAESENEKIISALEDMDLPDGFNVDSLDSAIDSGQYASITGKDDDPDNEMNVNAFTGEDGKVEYGINIGSGHDMIYFNSKEEAIEATEKLLDDATIRDAMNGESDPPGVTLADLGDHAKNVLKSDDDESKPIPAAPMETKVINGVKYRAIKESKKPKKHFLKENYERFFGPINEKMTEYSPEKVDQQDAMAKKLRSKKVDGYSFSIDQNSGGWEWNGPNGYFYATPWDTLIANAGGSSAGNPNIVKVEAFDNDNEEIMDTEMRYVHSGNMSKDLNAYLKVVKTIILKSKLK